MTRTLERQTKWFAAAAAGLLLLAGCGADASSEGGAGGDPGAQAGDVVGTATVDGRMALVDADGNTLYTNEAEADGTVRCVDSCAGFWPPLTIEGDVPDVADVTGLGLVERPDGSSQLALDGVPLYTFSLDEGPGSAEGEGFTDEFQGTEFVWHVAAVDGSAPATQDSEPGMGY